MTWGKQILGEELYEEQSRVIAAAENPWGPLIELPEPEASDEPLLVAPEGIAPPPPEEEQLSIATLEQRLAVDPKFWEDGLRLELTRQAPRKNALKAILRAMREDGADSATIEQAEQVLSALQ